MRPGLTTHLAMRIWARISLLHVLIHPVFTFCLLPLVTFVLLTFMVLYPVTLFFLFAPSLLHTWIMVLLVTVKLGVVFQWFLLLLARWPGGQP